METVKLVSACSIFFSIITILSCITLVPMLYAEISSVWEEIDVEIAEFKAESDLLWREMQKIGRAGGARIPRQYGGGVQGGSAGGYGPASNCECNANNNCPAGPAGPKGQPGHSGDAGMRVRKFFFIFFHSIFFLYKFFLSFVAKFANFEILELFYS